MKKLFDINAEWKSLVPRPVFDACPEYSELYWKAWELAHDHLTDIPGMPQTPYMDEAFCDTEIWIWDTCFMSLFCKYAQQRFPGVETLNNFYAVLYGNHPLPKIITQNAPAWTGNIIGEEAQIVIHILDNPPLFAWAELSNALISGDREHIRTLLLQKQYLQKHFDLLENLTTQIKVRLVRNHTCLIKHQYGYFWEGGRSGMDNTPRGRTGTHAKKDRPNHPRMLWVDAISQQALAAHCIAKLAKIIDEPGLAAEWNTRYNGLKETVNRYYWDDQDSFYYDIHADTLERMKVMTPASFWTMLAGIPDDKRAELMLRHLRDPRELGGEIPLVSLARNDTDFNNDNGNYWRGSLWIPTAYMSVKGLENYGQFDLAADCAQKIIAHMNRTYREYTPHTIWECYNPNRPEPARSCDENHRIVRPDFCGWSALAPISLYIENVIGIHSIDAFKREIKWHITPGSNGKVGLKNLRFGDTVTDLLYENGFCLVTADHGYTLEINSQIVEIKPGENRFKINLG